MSQKQDEALALFAGECNCCQAVIAAMGEKYGLSREDCIRVGAAFGGGMRRGEVCGAVTGALMVLGLRHGASAPGEPDKKKEANAKTIEFMKTFEERFGSYLCRELIKANGKKICDQAIGGAVGILEEMGV
ncbi:MAG: C-GCAxxG-C-C family protein [Planctomycetaceae bacterium]|nr:C-GCAxxG-C-C family protein [Planctomycetaceae bacterium]